jgi:hypothetical protein
VTAAVYLYAATGDRAYEEWLADNLTKAKPYRDFGWTRYNADQGEALLFYAELPEADAALRARILADKRKDVATKPAVYGFAADDDLYRAALNDEQYHWGSHQVRANYGSSNLDAVRHRAFTGNPAPLTERAIGILHYFHGVNPFGIVYLSNMYALGATKSVDTLWHGWYAPKSKWNDARSSPCGPAPGYVTGGPNVQAGANGVPATMKPPVDQPRQKSWRDYNAGWPDAAWVVNEPAIYYQAAYIRLLAPFAEKK